MNVVVNLYLPGQKYAQHIWARLSCLWLSCLWLTHSSGVKAMEASDDKVAGCSAGAQLKVHEPTVKLMQAHYAKTGKEVNKARLRMATLPEGAEVVQSA